MPSEIEVESFIRNYVNALEKLIEEKYPQAKSMDYRMGFPVEFPVKAIAYLGERGIIINYFKSDKLEVSVKKGEETKQTSKLAEFILYGRFLKLKDKAFEKAEADINELLDIPRQIEENQKELDRQAEQLEALMYEDMAYKIKHYLEFLDSTKDVIEKTTTDKITEVDSTISLIQNHISRYEFSLLAGCQTMDKVYLMVNSDMETSFFLALNGKYFAASSLLRKILEVNIKAIYLDVIYLQNKQEGIDIRDKWLSNGKFNLGFPDIVDKLLDNRHDVKITSLLSRLKIIQVNSLNEHIKSRYKELCTYVHLRPTADLEKDDILLFTEFDENRFDQFHTLFYEIVRICEIMLILQFPKIISLKRIGDDEPYTNFSEFSTQELNQISSI